MDKEKLDKIKMPCLECGKIHEFDEGNIVVKAGLNVFCSDKDCEDRYAFKQ